MSTAVASLGFPFLAASDARDRIQQGAFPFVLARPVAIGGDVRVVLACEDDFQWPDNYYRPLVEIAGSWSLQ